LEIIADNLKKAGWSLGYVAAMNCEGRQSGLLTRITATERRFVVRADEKQTAFLELESAIRREKLERRPKS
jgi:hypothetical protein